MTDELHQAAGMFHLFELPDGSRVSELLTRVSADRPAFSQFVPRLKVIVNGVPIGPEDKLEGSNVAYLFLEED